MLLIAYRRPTPTALLKRSGGRVSAFTLGSRHPTNAPMTPRLLRALVTNGAAIPSGPMIVPASAGPIARLKLKPMLFADTAPGSSSLGTRLGTTACHAGEVNAPQTLTRNMNHRSETGVTQLNHT